MSRFIDKVRVYLKAGDGGRGCVAFRREKFVPRGGPSGGDGGNGGSIIFKVDSGMSTLYDFRYHPHLRAKNGRPGMGDKMSGKAGEDLVVRVPPGTTIKDVDTGAILADLTSPGQEAVLARGGRGGRGNQHFATPTDRAPRKFEEGTPGEEKVVELELRSIADVGLVGFPNAGKSTFLRAVSNATPEVAPYPFTTLTPHLGVVERAQDKIVIADIPGLVEGASQGKGLGREFLRHIERTAVLLYVVDGSQEDPIADFLAVRREVLSYSESMKAKRSLVAVNKEDIVGKERLEEVVLGLSQTAGVPVFSISAEKATGVGPLLDSLFEAVLEDRERISVQ